VDSNHSAQFIAPSVQQPARLLPAQQTTPEYVLPSDPGNCKTPIQFVGTLCQSPQKMQMQCCTHSMCRIHKTCRCMRGMELGTIPPVAKPRNPSTTTRSKFSSQAATVFSNRFSHRDGWHHSPRLAVWGKRQWNIIKQLFLLVLSRLHKPSPSGS